MSPASPKMPSKILTQIGKVKKTTNTQIIKRLDFWYIDIGLCYLS